MKVENNQDNLIKCICKNCPTRDECMKGKMEGFFCARDKSTCDLEKKGCICGECPLSSEYQLSGSYYCENGIA